MASRKNGNNKKTSYSRKTISRAKNSQRNKSQIVWPYSNFEKKCIENAELKMFKPTLKYVNLLNKGKFRAQLEYMNIENNVLEKIDVQFKIYNEKNIKGIPFSIKIPKVLPIGAVNEQGSYGLDLAIHIKNDKLDYLIPAHSISDFRTKYPSKPQIIKGLIKQIKTFQEVDDLAYYRLVIPISDNNMIFPTDILSYKDNYLKFDNEGWNRQTSLLGIPFLSTKGMYVSLKVKDHTFQFYGLEPLRSIIIDSKNKLSKKEFKEITQIIRTCFAFLVGKFYKDETIYLSSSYSDFSIIESLEYIVEEKSIISNNQLINPRLVNELNSIIESKEEQYRPQSNERFSISVFSNFCEKALKSNELLRCLELIITASGLNNPIQKGALYSVSLETITELIKDEYIETLKPIKNKEIQLEFRKQIDILLNSFEDKIDTSGMTILRAKLNNINSPTNHDKLIKPFELMGINLSDEEKAVLSSRNDYLHGNNPKKIGDQTELELNAQYLHSLIGMLILKYVGYSGHFIHLPNLYLQKQYVDVMYEIQKIDFDNVQKIMERYKSEDMKNKKEFKEIKKSFDHILLVLHAIKEVSYNIIRII